MIFLDRESLSWGDNWRSSIDNTLTMSSFFIPVISPRYFKRPECRRELLDYHRQATARGNTKYLLPLNYASVVNFSGDNPDELIALTARTQYVDWTRLRLMDERSEEYRTGVNQLARRLVELQNEIEERERAAEAANPGSGGDQSIGLIDALDKVGELLPHWLNAVESDPVKIAQHDAIMRAYAEKRSRARPNQLLAIRHREATDLLEIAKDALALAEAYLSSTIELNPFVTALVRGVRASPESAEVLTPLRDAVLEAKQAIDAWAASPPSPVASGTWRKEAHLGRTFKDLADTHEKSENVRIEANQIVMTWFNEIEAATPSPVGH